MYRSNETVPAEVFTNRAYDYFQGRFDLKVGDELYKYGYRNGKIDMWLYVIAILGLGLGILAELTQKQLMAVLIEIITLERDRNRLQVQAERASYTSLFSVPPQTVRGRTHHQRLCELLLQLLIPAIQQ